MSARVVRAALFVQLFLAGAAFGAVRGSVYSDKGVPVAGAKVSAFAPEAVIERRERILRGLPRKPLASSNATAKGDFLLEVDAPASLDLVVEADGYVPESMAVTPDEDAVGVVIRQATPVRGSVTCEGKGVGGASVVYLSATGAERSAKTGDDGSFSVPDPARWASEVVVHHPAYAILDVSPWDQSLDEATGGAPPAALNLERGVSLRGSVTDSEGKPVEGCRIYVDGWPSGLCGEGGRFQLEHVPTKHRAILAASGGSFGAATSSGEGVAIRLAPGRSLSGAARERRRGNAIAGARVAAVDAGTGWHASTVSDANGAFRLEPLPPGQYAIEAEASDLFFNLEAPTVDLRRQAAAERKLEGSRLARVAGRVLDPDGKPIGGATVGTGQAFGGLSLSMAGLVPGSARTTTDGRFVLRAYAVEGRLRARHPAYGPASSESLKVASGESLGGVELRLARGIAFRGRVRDEGGRPVEGVMIGAAEPGSGVAEGVAAMVGRFDGGFDGGFDGRFEPLDAPRTGPDGSFALLLGQGKWTLAFSKRDYVVKKLPSLELGKGSRPIEVVLERGAALEGRIVRSNGAGVGGVRVALRGEASYASGLTAPDGSFRVTALAPGPYVFSAFKEDAFVFESRQVSVPSRPLTVTLQDGATLRGRALDGATRAPITRFSLQVTPPKTGSGEEGGAWPRSSSRMRRGSSSSSSRASTR